MASSMDLKLRGAYKELLMPSGNYVWAVTERS